MAQYNTSSNNIYYNTPVTLSGAGDVTATLADYIIGVDDTAVPRSVTLPAPSTTGATANEGKIYIVKDQSGGAATNNITVQPASGTIDGGASVLINSNYGEVQVYCDGSAWYSSAGPELNLPLSVSEGGTGATSLTDGGVILGSGTAAVTVTAQPTDGQLLIGDTGTDPVLATLTEGAGIVITEGAGSITIASPSSTTWSLKAAGATLAASEGFISTAGTAQSFPLPATASVGDVFELTQNGAGAVTITQAAGQSVRLGNVVTTAGTGGSLASSAQGDAVKLVCVTADTEFQAVAGVIGNWVIT